MKGWYILDSNEEIVGIIEKGFLSFSSMWVNNPDFTLKLIEKLITDAKDCKEEKQLLLYIHCFLIISKSYQYFDLVAKKVLKNYFENYETFFEKFKDEKFLIWKGKISRLTL
jgi:hypothetical protein